MKKATSGIRQSSMFLIELIIAILFLALCSAICIRLFVSARVIENDSYNLTHAVSSAQNIAEVFENGSDNLKVYFPCESSGDSFVTIYFDSNFTPCAKDSCVYAAYITISETNALSSANIEIKKASDSNDLIYTLHVDHAKGGVSNV